MKNGDSYMLDRGLPTNIVATTINEARGKNRLVEFKDNQTPSRTIYIDPDEVASIMHNGNLY
jgi:hypothetical protein